MALTEIVAAVRENLAAVVFVNVLLQQLGLPVPVVPTLLLAGSLAVGWVALGTSLALAIVASVLADGLWYWAGRGFGYRVLAGLCKLSINPTSCVSLTEARFTRWGVWSLLVAKFVPGFSTVAPPIAGALRMSLPRFLLAAAAGAGLWAGAALGTGWMLREAAPDAIAVLERHSASVVQVVALLVGLWLAWKFWQKYRFQKLSALPQTSPGELLAAMGSENPPLLLDLRGETMIAQTAPVTGAVVAVHDRLHEAVRNWPRDRPIVTLCACPEDAGAIQAARHLIDKGYLSVRPLRGGYEAWLAAVGKESPAK
ncbi:MAG: VTT domain-containing protein [Betaproteobacteria bacterium]|nr:VTT domain-containing protein [Betaproteobacteria bacterium]MBK7793749.1 VTT domain-containing protein [Betaproteobacteria bacterium]MBK8690344.1 VTT domain-containing protein [Betaproteobacteria bacterium]